MSGTKLGDSNDLGVAPMTAEVRTCITSLILATMGQVKTPSASTQIVYVDEVVVY